MDKTAFYAAYHNGATAASLARHVELVKTAGETHISGSFLEKLSADDWEKLSASFGETWDKIKTAGGDAWNKFKEAYSTNPNLRKALWGVGGGLAGYGIDRMLGGRGLLGGALGAGAGYYMAPDKIPSILQPDRGLKLGETSPGTLDSATKAGPSDLPAPAAPQAVDKVEAPQERPAQKQTVGVQAVPIVNTAKAPAENAAGGHVNSAVSSEGKLKGVVDLSAPKTLNGLKPGYLSQAGDAAGRTADKIMSVYNRQG